MDWSEALSIPSRSKYPVVYAIAPVDPAWATLMPRLHAKTEAAKPANPEPITASSLENTRLSVCWILIDNFCLL
jgi:hypothetical protein